MNYITLIFGILIVIYIFVFLKLYYVEKQHAKYKFGTKQIVRVAVFGALSGIFYIFIKFPVPFFPSFLEFHFDEVPAFIASFAYGPISGILVLLIKTLIKLPFTKTLGVGELSDLIYSAAFILPAALIYKRHRNFKGVFTGLLIGTVFQLAISLISNVYVMIPFYMKVMELPESVILGWCKLANPKINNLGWSYGLIAVLPFNAIKDAMVILLTLFTYKSVHRFIDKLHE
jgi:riboflavin transporter FmnP